MTSCVLRTISCLRTIARGGEAASACSVCPSNGGRARPRDDLEGKLLPQRDDPVEHGVGPAGGGVAAAQPEAGPHLAAALDRAHVVDQPAQVDRVLGR